MTFDLQGKRAFVCGASKGIGRATAEAFAERGVSVTLIARRADVLHDVAASLAVQHGQKHHALVADFQNLDSLKPLFDSHIAAHGPAHIVVNNSGGPAAGPVSTASPDAFIAAFSQHVLASHILMQAVLEGMKSEGYGRFINVISTSVKQPIHGLGVSNTVRGAMASWAKTLAGEVAAFGITVNNVLPGSTETDRLDEILKAKAAQAGQPLDTYIKAEKEAIPAKRFGTPRELADVIAFLASPAAGYINGINLPVDGGRTGSL